MAVSAKVVRIPGAMTEVMLNDGATVADALAAANTSLASGEGLTVNSLPATLDTPLAQGNVVVVSKSAKGAI